ncbi:putative suppressor of ty, partial [Fasciola hepatica]
PKRRLVLDDEDDDEADSEEVAAKKVARESHDDREVIARQIFEDDDEEMPSGRTVASKPANFRVTGEDEEDEEEEGEYDAINLGNFSPKQTSNDLSALLEKYKPKRRLVLDDEDDDEADSEEVAAKKVARESHDDREVIARQIFEDDDEEMPSGRTVASKPANFRVTGEDEEDEEEEGEYDDIRDFIVDDRANEAPTKAPRRIVHKGAALQQAQSIFGVDFDMSEFEAFRKGPAEGDEYSEESEPEYSDDEEATARPRRKSRKSRSNLIMDDRVYEFFDPSDLERAYYSLADDRIRKTDIPERFQLRQVPVHRVDPSSPNYAQEQQELTDEAAWIYSQAFKEEPEFKPTTVIPKILDTLKLLRESLFEVPFIALYRKECIERDLNIKDLWRIYQLDEKWTVLQQRKRNMIHILQKLHDFFGGTAPEDPGSMHQKHMASLLKLIAWLVFGFRIKLLYSFFSVRSAESVEEVNDVRLNYLLYYSCFAEPMKQWFKRQQDKDSTDKDESVGGESTQQFNFDALDKSVPVTMSTDPFTGRPIRQRQARATASYEVAQRAGIGGLVQRFGLSAAQFAENVQDQYLRHDVDQCPMLPLDAAGDFLSPQFPSASVALSASRYMLAFQISREPFVRRMMRQMFQLQAVITVRPTSRGVKEIDESHPLYALKYISGKPVAARDKLITYNIHVPAEQIRGLSLADELQRFFHQDEFSSLVQAWNEQRSLVLKQAAEEFIYPTLIRELREKLLESSQQAVLRLCAKKLFTYLQVAPYPADGHRSYEADTEDADSPFPSGRSRHDARGHGDPDAHGGGSVWPKGARVLSMALKDEDDARESVVSAVHLDSNGEVVDFLHFHGLLQSNRVMDDLKKAKDNDMQRLTNFMVKHRPQVIVIGCNCRRALYLQLDLQKLVDDLASERRLPRIHVELMETELAIVFAQSSRASADLPSSYSPLLRQAISLGRRLQDPLAEFAQLVNTEDEILGFRWHPLQDSLSRDKLLQTLEIEFINRVNEVGVDVNRCLSHPHTANLLQFVSGLGPRKALHMLKTLKHKKMFLTNRTQLCLVIGLGSRVLTNCAGFIKIDTGLVRDLDVDDVEILDSTRVHLESYHLAKKMAVDALEYEDTDECDPTAALEEIVRSPARLRELDLDAFAEELKRQDHGDKHITLYDIRKELNNRYRDYRTPYQSANPELIFSMVTHETPETFHVGRLVECRVIAVATRRPRPEQLDSANPTKNEANGSWMCPFCRQDNFQFLNHVWSHFDNDECPGQPVGLRVQLDNGIAGFVPLRLTDPPSEKLFERAFPGALIQCRVVKIDITKFNVELTCKKSDLQDDQHMWRPRPDPFYDYEAEERDAREEEEAKAKAEEKTAPYLSRVIFHPYFKNISYDQLAAMEPDMEPGSIVIRPSRKGTDHLTVSWKVDDGIMQHIDVLEKEKSNSFSLGRVLIIGDEEFEDLDEIVARHVQPMVSLVRDIMSYRYYRESMGGDRAFLGSLLQQEKTVNPDRIPYFLSSTKERPGYFTLAYMPNKTPHYELFSVRPEGFRFRRLIFPTLDRMITWFKEHYNDVAGGNYLRERDFTTRSPRVPRTPQAGYTHGSYALSVQDR